MKEILTREGGIEGYYPQAFTVWGGTIESMTEPVTPILDLDISDVNFVIVTETIPYVMVQRKKAPWGPTFAGWVKYAKANPGKLTYISNVIGSGNDTACEWVMDTLEIKVEKIPQRSMRAALSAVGAGEGDFTMSSIDYVKPDWEGGRVDITMFLASKIPPPWDKDPNIVTSEKAGLPPVPMGIIPSFMVPKACPPSHVDWLFKLIKAGVLTDVYKQREKMFPGLTINILGPKEANELKMKLHEYGERVIRATGLHWEQQKKK
jgi:tripartite-type tricarboxylate transporter receptor subunit TctC